MRYQDTSEITKTDFLEVVASGVITHMCQAVVDAVHSIEDYDWLLCQFKHLLGHPNDQIRGVTATCIGHIARLDLEADGEELLRLLRPMLSDVQIVGQVEDAIDDVRIFSQ